jgi:predicted metal-binding membrane protein
MLAAGVPQAGGRVIARAWRRPAASVEALTVCAWAATAAMLTGETVARAAPGHGAIWWCGLGGMAGMGTSGSAGALPARLAGGMPMWMAMACAMMLPATFATARRVAEANRGSRGHAAVGHFLAGYLLVWATYGALALTLASVLEGGAARPAALALVLALAASWQLTGAKLRLLRAMRDPAPLPAASARRSLQTLAYGSRSGVACVGSCWAIMLVMALAGGERLLWMAALSTLVLVEHRARPERRVVGLGAGMLGLAGLVGVGAQLIG